MQRHLKEEEILREGGGKAGQDRQRKMGRLPARERIARLFDRGATFFEIGLWAAYKMYEQWGSVPAAGAVVGHWKCRRDPVHDYRE